MNNPYMGTWRIIEMEQWDQDYIDLVVPGYITFSNSRRGIKPSKHRTLQIVFS